MPHLKNNNNNLTVLIFLNGNIKSLTLRHVIEVILTLRIIHSGLGLCHGNIWVSRNLWIVVSHGHITGTHVELSCKNACGR